MSFQPDGEHKSDLQLQEAMKLAAEFYATLTQRKPDDIRWLPIHYQQEKE